LPKNEWFAIEHAMKHERCSVSEVRLRLANVRATAIKRGTYCQASELGDFAMTADQKKELVTKTWLALGRGDIEAAFANMDHNVSWLVPGNMTTSGVKKGKDEILKFMSGVGAVFPEGMKIEIRRTYCDGDTVIVELTNRGKVSNGKQYENEYCFVFELENGKVRRIREYVDTQKFADTVTN